MVFITDGNDKTFSRAHQMVDCSTLWARRMQNFAVRLMSVLVVRGYIQLMQSVTEGDLGHQPALTEMERDAMDTFPHKDCSLENDPSPHRKSVRRI